MVAYDPHGVVAGAFTVHTPPYYGFLHVYVDDPNTPGDEGIQDGDEVRFTIDGRLATPSKSTVWNSGVDEKEVNLEVTMPFVATDEWVDFWGTLTINGEPAPAGTIVAAYDPDGVYTGDHILTQAGQYGFLHAYGDDATTATDEGAEAGDNLTFVAFLPLSETPIALTLESGTATWQGRGSRTEINLTGSGGAVPGAPTSVTITGPAIGETNKSYTFTIVVYPSNVTTPITYVIEHTGLTSPLIASINSRAIFLKNRTWDTPGPKVITVTASNGLGSAVGTHTILIAESFTFGPSGGTKVFTDTNGLRTTIEIPSGALSEATTFTYTPKSTIAHPISSSFGFAGHSFDLDASPQIVGQITITIEYRDQDWMDADIAAESSLRLYYWNAGLGDWDDVANTCGTPAPTYAPDTDANVLAAPVCHLSEFAMLGVSGGEQFKIYLPAVLKE